MNQKNSGLGVGIVILIFGLAIVGLNLALSSAIQSGEMNCTSSDVHISMILGAMFSSLGIGIFVFALAKSARQKSLRKSGARAMATVTEVTKCKYRYSDSFTTHEYYEISYYWKDPETDTSHRGESKCQIDPRPYLSRSDQKLPVYYEPNNASRHFLDLSGLI
ncbi:MAG: DUF3592 domain-containing protein [Clostridiales bacterium]|nr:DUF3592 domain-containing protein [Clostridiales bacterium]